MEEMLNKHSLLSGLQPLDKAEICPEELMLYPQKADREESKTLQTKLKRTSNKCYCLLSACCIPGTESRLVCISNKPFSH